ncbi:MAG: DNA translocase FtsK 4TM domain-containing protein, partial [Firmicutes bacterium]|nr:DNA translocase FtsK 4TM domain-containing protein [Bacillota bacterium]
MANGTRTPKRDGKSLNARKPQNRTHTGKRPRKSEGTGRSIKEKPVKINRSYISAGLLMLVVSVIIGIFTYSSNQDKIGIGGTAIHNCLLGLFSTSAYLLPPALFGLGIYTLKVKRTNKLFGKICLCVLETVLIGALIMLFYKGEYPHIASLWGYGINGGVGGGVLGGMAAVALSKLIGRTASLIVVLAAFAAVLFAIFNFSFSDLRDMLAELKPEKEEEDTEFVPVYTKEDKMIEQKAEKKEEKPQIDLGFLEEVASQLPQTEGVKELLEEQKKKGDEKPKKAEKATDAEKEEVKGEIEKSIEKPFANYVFPPISILNEAAKT